MWSLPVWEEWIEMGWPLLALLYFSSLPVWEEWIEISDFMHKGMMEKSLPVWEEWIEMLTPLNILSGAQRLFPYGKSGLK